MSLIILFMLFSKGPAQLQSILTAPRNVTGKLNGTVKFDCEVEFTDVLVWEFNSNVIYSFQNKNEDYPVGRGRYSVEQDGRHFKLIINDLQCTDGGIYTCRVLSESAVAHLIVIDKPEIVSSNDKSVEGSTVQYTCTARFAGPNKQDIQPEQYPQLTMHLDNRLLNATVHDKNPDGSNNCRQLEQIQNITLKADMNGKELICDIGTSDPPMHENITNEVKVFYSVNNIEYTLTNEHYEVGSVIKCSADGNPLPQFTWSDTKNTENVVEGNTLQITEKMVQLGGNVWICTASNTIYGKVYTKNVTAIFETVPLLEPGNGSWKIAVGVIVPLFLVIGGIIAWRLKLQRKKSSVEQESNVPVSPDTSCKDPLLNKKTEDSVKKSQDTHGSKACESSDASYISKTNESAGYDVTDDKSQNVMEPESNVPESPDSKTNESDEHDFTSDKSQNAEDTEKCMTDFENNEWFHGILPKEEMKNLLKRDGDYLVTNQTEKKAGRLFYELYIMKSDGIECFIIQYHKGKWSQKGENEFISVEELARSLGGIQHIARQEWELDGGFLTYQDPSTDENGRNIIMGIYNEENVALKVYREKADVGEAFLQEIHLLRKYNNHNIAKFIGITITKQPLVIVMENKCGLLQVLRDSNLLKKTKGPIPMCKDVATGMEYLGTQNCIHRDLAARNCLVGKDKSVKIANFFMAREQKEYVSSSDEAICVKWTAPEGIMERKFTPLSDVWSFGVLMWEIFSSGKTPYKEIPDDDLLKQIKDGHRLPAEETPSNVYKIMTDCWKMMPEERPNFTDIIGRLH